MDPFEIGFPTLVRQPDDLEEVVPLGRAVGDILVQGVQVELHDVEGARDQLVLGGSFGRAGDEVLRPGKVRIGVPERPVIEHIGNAHIERGRSIPLRRDEHSGEWIRCPHLIRGVAPPLA